MCSDFSLNNIGSLLTCTTDDDVITLCVVGTTIKVINLSKFELRPTLTGTKNLNENGPNPFFFPYLMGTRMAQIRIAKSV